MDTNQIRKTMILISQSLNKLSRSVALGIVSFLLLPITLYAQDALVLSVSPTLFEMTANESQTWSSNVRVINANAFPITVYATPVNFEPAGDAGQGNLIPVFDQEATGDTLAEWISVTQEEITVPPEQTVNVPFTITVPTGAAPGGHFAAILIGTKSFGQGEGSALVETSQVVTSLVFLRVAGDIQESGSIRQFTTAKSVYETADATFVLRFQNDGNVHIQPQGEIEVRNMWGKVRGKVPINRNSQFGNVLPESVRTYTFEWSSSWSLADVGRHSAVVTLAYGEETRQFADATTYFWVIPWKLLLLALFILGSIVALFVWAIKLYVRKMLLLAGVTPELSKHHHRAQVSVTAPIEAGILDLRSELEHGTGSMFARFWSFVKHYKVAVMIVATIVVFVVLIIWYVILMATSDYSYQVTLKQPDGTVVPLAVEQAASVQAESAADAISITTYNQSGVSDAIAQVESKLDANTYRLVESFETVDTEKARSVIVYNPAFLEIVSELQKALPGVLVSSYESDDPDDPPIILYIGNDIVN